MARGLRPFQRRLHRQRITVGLLRTLAAAIVVAILIMLPRVFGVALPLPLPIAPLAGAGVVLLAGLVVLPWQQPAPARMAHALDRCLGLREQLGSALELSHDEARQSDMATRLRLRAEATLRDVPPTRVLPWPSMHRERRSLVGLALLAAGTALLAAHAPNPGNSNGQQLAASRDRAHTGSPARPAPANPLPRRPSAPIEVIALGNATLARAGQGMPPGARRVAAASPQTLQSGNGRGGATTRIVAGKALTHSGANATGTGATTGSQAGQNGAGGNRNGPGNASTSGGQGNQGTGASANGRRAGNGHGAGSRSGNGTGGPAGAGLQPGQNKGSGGVMNPQQQALANLQNSISSAQQQGQGGNSSQGVSQGGAQGQMQGQNGRAGTGQDNGSHGQQGQGQGRSGARGSRGQQGQGRGQGSPSGNGTGGTGQGSGAGQGNGSTGSRRIGSSSDGYDGYGGRFGQYGSDSGANGGDAQGTSGSPARTNGQGPARLSNGSGVVLNGTQGGPQGGNTGLILTVGLPQQAAGSGSSAPTDTNSPTVNVPGYVAPDSNAVAPDERDVVRAYFSPHDSSN